MPRIEYTKLSDGRTGEASTGVRVRVEAARDIQRARLKDVAGVACNADMRPAEVRKFCQLDEASSNLMRAAMNQMNLSARAYHRTLKLARTIADLAASPQILPQHLAEALQYRPRMADN